MKGFNEILVNHSTAMDAFQEYLDKRYSPHIKVVRVVPKPNGLEWDFNIRVGEKTEQTPC